MTSADTRQSFHLSLPCLLRSSWAMSFGGISVADYVGRVVVQVVYGLDYTARLLWFLSGMLVGVAIGAAVVRAALEV